MPSWTTSRQVAFSNVGVPRATHKVIGTSYAFSDFWRIQSWIRYSIFKSFKRNLLKLTKRHFSRQQGVIPPIYSSIIPRLNKIVFSGKKEQNRVYYGDGQINVDAKHPPSAHVWANSGSSNLYICKEQISNRTRSHLSGSTLRWQLGHGINPLKSKRLKECVGSISYYHIPDIKRSKLDAKGREKASLSLWGATDEQDGLLMFTSLVTRLLNLKVTWMPPEWIDAMKAELEMIKKNNTWKLVDLPKGKNAIATINKFIDSQCYKALYGLKQAPRAWYAKIDAHLLNHNFRRSSSESTLYIKQFNSQERLIISLYVDDLLVIGSNDHLVKKFKKQMESVSYFLGMEIKQLPNGVHISQRKYASDMLKKFKMFLCKPVTSPLVYKCKLSKDDGKKLVNPTRFRGIVGSLLYLTISRPDLAFVIAMIHKKSTSGYIFTLGSGVFCWNSKKQSVVAQSSAEAEYISVAGAVNHAIWIRKLLSDLDLTQEGPTAIFCDNKSAIAIAENPVQHGRTKHINVKYHDIREAEKNEEVKLKYCTSKTQLTDMLTKSITGRKLNYFKARIMESNNNLKEE
ncbi:retrovirus-related pol polyprotein from transposon RE1 [Tanacetum coccineum]